MLETVAGPAELGARVAQARDEAGLTQGALAAELGIDRTSLVRIESGERKVSASELATIAQIVDRPIDWFVVLSPPIVVSRRSSGDVQPFMSGSYKLGRAVERRVGDVDFLIDKHIIECKVRKPVATPRTHAEAERLAAQIRRRCKVGDEPLIGLNDVAEQLGVYAFVLDLPGASDGACVERIGPKDCRAGVVVINGAMDPGRRRWTLAHELAHFITGDAYDVTNHPTGQIERFLDSFVAYFLMPRSGVLRIWNEAHNAPDGPRRVALTVAARYRTSWSAACNQLANLELITRAAAEGLRRAEPTRGDYVVLGETWTEELMAPLVPTGYARSVLAAYSGGRLTPERTVELLAGSLTVDDLPARPAATWDELRAAFDPTQ